MFRDLNGIVWAQATDDTILANGNITIGARAFYGCTGVNNEEWAVSLPSQVKSIGESAFEGCGMKSFVWGNNDAPQNYVISNAAFRNCPNLACFAADAVKAIGAYAFFGCASLDDNAFANIVSSAEGVIGNYAFARCFSLSDITIPQSITGLGEGCFSRSGEGVLYGHYYTLEDGKPAGVGTDARYTGITDFEDWMSAMYGGKRFDVWKVFDETLRITSSTYGSLKVRWGEFNGNDEWETPSGASVGSACFMNCQGLDIEWNKFPALSLIPAYCFYNCNIQNY